MRNKVILIRPARILADRAYVSLQVPLNLAYLASYLLGHGFAAGIWDFEVNASWEEFARAARAEEQEIIAFGLTAFTPTINNAHACAQALKRDFPGIPVIIGGPHVSALPEGTLAEFPAFDIGVIGEGEEKLSSICDCIRGGRPYTEVPGIACREGGKIILTAPGDDIHDPDVFPFPARRFFDSRRYQGHHASRGFSRRFLNIAEIITSRGCPYRCIFCGRPERSVRFRSVTNLLAEVDCAVGEYGVNHLCILDDIFTLDESRVSAFCRGMRKLRGVSWDCYSRVDTVTPGLLREMAGANCRKISFGVESGSPKILELIRKGITVEQVRAAVAHARSAGIRCVESSFVIGGHPDETREDILLTRRLIREISPDILMLAVAVPYPGSPLRRLMIEAGLIDGGAGWDSYTFSEDMLHWRTRHTSSTELVALRNAILREFYLRPGYIMRTLLSARSVGEVLYWKDMGLNFMRNVAGFRRRAVKAEKCR